MDSNVNEAINVGANIAEATAETKLPFMAKVLVILAGVGAVTVGAGCVIGVKYACKKIVPMFKKKKEEIINPLNFEE